MKALALSDIRQIEDEVATSARPEQREEMFVTEPEPTNEKSWLLVDDHGVIAGIMLLCLLLRVSFGIRMCALWARLRCLSAPTSRLRDSPEHRPFGRRSQALPRM